MENYYMNISRKLKFGIAGTVVGMAASFVFADNVWLEEQRSEKDRQLVYSVLADADSRSNLLGNGSPVTVNVHGFMQTRWSYNDIKTDGVDATHGFNVPRARLELSGDLYDWGYKVSGQWSDGGNLTLMDAYADWGSFRVGQFKSPFMKEVLTAQTDTLAAERSVVASQFGQGRSQGIQYGYNTSFGGVTVAYTDGFNTANGAGVQNGYALTGRVDVNAVDWLDFGFAFSHNDLDTFDYNTWTADATFSAGGFDFTGAYVATIDDTNGDNWGTVWTASYDVTDKAQLFGQYEIGHLEGVETDLKIATFGVNYAFNDNVKWTTDVGYAFDSVDAGWNLGNSGWNTTANEGETLIRTQLQVKF